MLSLFFNSVSLLVTYIIPTVSTYKALESNSKDSFETLLIYWVVFAGLHTFESNFYFILRFMPFYNFVKLYLSFWLILPQSKGSEYIYFNLLQPFLNRYLSPFENWINELNIRKLFNIFIGTNRAPQQHPDSNPSLLVDVLFKGTDYNNKSNVGISFWSSLFRVVQYLPHNVSLDSINKGKAEHYSATSETEANNSNGFDVVDKSDIDIIKDQQVEMLKTDGWFSNWWIGKDSKQPLKEKNQ